MPVPSCRQSEDESCVVGALSPRGGYFGSLRLATLKRRKVIIHWFSRLQTEAQYVAVAYITGL